MKNRVLTFLLALLCLSVLSPAAFAASNTAFSPMLSEAEGREGDTVELSVPYDGSLGEIGAFLVRVEFDPEIFEYRQVKTAPVIRDAVSLTLPGEGRIDSGYVLKNREECLAAPGDTFTYRFRVKEGAKTGKAVLSASVFQIVSPDSTPLASSDIELSYEVLPPLREEASLLSLSSAVGELRPAFSPDCFSYTMTVPFEVTSLAFSAEAAEGGVCKVNRKNLGAGGSETEFLLTVTAENGMTKAVYRIMVHREEKASSAPLSQTASTPRTGKAPTPAAGKASGETESSQITQASSMPDGEADAPSSPAVPVSEAAVPVRKNSETEEAASQPSLAVRGGEESLFPLGTAIVFVIAVSAASGPLARFICGRIGKKKK